jgi:simple sugar transport system permease protein
MHSGFEWAVTPAFAGAAVQAAIPLFLVLLAALVCDRAGLVNLGLEGMMLAGACVGAVMAMRLGPGPGLAFGVLAGVWLALLHALATIQFGVDRIVSGLAVNLLAFGATPALGQRAFGPSGVSPRLAHLQAIGVPWLGGLSPLVPLALLIGLAVLLALRFGTAGPRLETVASAPLLAESAGLDTYRLRYGALALCGALAGLAGAGLSIEFAGHYQPGSTQGRGFLALALCLLVGRSVLAALAATCFLAALQAIPAFLAAGRGTSLLAAAPWLVVLLALAVLGHRAYRWRTVPDQWRADIRL